MGLKHKIRLGAWFRPAFVLLRSLKGLRSTPLDIFGYDKMRRLERALIEEYTDSVRGILASLHADNLETATAIAALPDMIRGYEDVKLRNVAQYREQLAELLSAFAQPSHRRHTSAS
jgi:indolepyruvate ferredoxin oxidoreductase